ncbi:DUF2860 family protein [Sphingorhabdus sp. 109]|jgi:hypothetical protein|uniref:DUF2860 family protein n=1 Tax=Sphingorhabdus sp. 109 TaxID=2653173 RepID=UPI0012F3F1AD|nr:DUF2860 family protein [Sphingorhabdus sp. 109]VWX62124.1 conserved exported hypothetical protein [Sphingorhabdus sp. 109]
MKTAFPIMTLAIAANFSGAAMANDGDFFATVEVAAGRDVVPADIIENGIDQDRIASVLESEVRLGYDMGPLLLDFGAEVALYPEDSRFNRYAFGPGLRADFPLGENAATKLRLGAEYQYVLGDDGRVFDRPRAEAQLIHRHSREHTTTARLRYGFRNQSEDRFTGFDQSEWLAELRHNWRPKGGPTSFNLSLLGLKHDADDNRFSYKGYGFRLVGRTPLAESLTGFGRMSVVQRDYEDDFSQLYPAKRSDTHIRAVAGLDYQAWDQVSLFAEAGFVSNASNIPVRDYDGFVGRIGLRYAFEFTDR